MTLHVNLSDPTNTSPALQRKLHVLPKRIFLAGEQLSTVPFNKGRGAGHSKIKKKPRGSYICLILKLRIITHIYINYNMQDYSKVDGIVK